MKPLHLSINNVIVCDDARTEDNGKAILIGIYTGTINPSKAPALMSFVLWFLGEVEGEGKFRIEIKTAFIPKDGSPPNERIGAVEGEVSTPADSGRQSFQLPVPTGPISMPSPGTLVISVKQMGGDAFQELVRKIVLTPSTSAEPSPS